jgi:transposase
MLPSDTLLVGVDVHRRRNVVQVMDGCGHILTDRLSLSNNRPGADALANHLARLAQGGNVGSIHVAAEATSNFWLPFFCHLQRAESLSDWPLALYPFNPRVIANFRKSFGDLDKTDLLDAHVIAERLRFGRDLPVPFVMEALYLPLRTLTRYRYHLVRELVRVKGYTLSLVYLKASEYNVSRAQRPFDRVFSATSQAVLREFQSMEDIAAMPFDELVEWLDGKGKRRFADPEENARRLQKVAENSYQLPEEWLETVNTALTLSLRHLNTLEQLLKRLDTAIEEQMEAFPNTLTTIPGIGPVFAAGIIAEVGDLSRFDYDQVKVASFAGLKWKRSQSGDFQAEETPRKRGGNTFLRYYLCEAAQHIRMHDAEYGAFYQRKYDEVPKHKHKRALVLTARKLVRLVVRLLTTNEPYRARRVGSGNST